METITQAILDKNFRPALTFLDGVYWVSPRKDASATWKVFKANGISDGKLLSATSRYHTFWQFH